MRTLTEALAEGHTLPAGYDTWGWKLVRPDLRTRNGYRWPWPGNTVTEADPDPDPDKLCSRGLHIALTPAAMQDVRYGPSTVLLLAYRQADVIARAESKIRASHAYVADVIDLCRLLRANGQQLDLTGAYLAGANLDEAYLDEATLTGADLAGATLAGATLARAYLARAYLARATLIGANLTGATLTGAYLARADLAGANLDEANLDEANLDEANLNGARMPDGWKAQAGAL